MKTVLKPGMFVHFDDMDTRGYWKVGYGRVIQARGLGVSMEVLDDNKNPTGIRIRSPRNEVRLPE